jgi:hypothetical protein
VATLNTSEAIAVAAGAVGAGEYMRSLKQAGKDYAGAAIFGAMLSGALLLFTNDKGLINDVSGGVMAGFLAGLALSP